MSKYGGLDKIKTDGLSLIETHNGKKIYECKDNDHPSVCKGILVVSRGYLIDEQLGSIENARDVADRF